MAPSSAKSLITATLRGAFVGDASNMGTHWIYDPAEMKEAVDSIDTPEFKTPPTPRFYSSEEFPNHYGNGMLSPYGEQLLFCTEFLGSSPNWTGQEMLDSMIDWADSFGGRPDHALTLTIQNVKEHSKQFPEAGADDDQAHCFLKAIPVTCLHMNDTPDVILAKVKEAIQVHQNNETAIEYGCAVSTLLQHLFQSKSLAVAIASTKTTSPTHIQDNMDRVLTSSTAETLDELLKIESNLIMKDQPDSKYYNMAARSCKLPGSFLGPLFLLQKVAEDDEEKKYTYAHCLRQNILASGDTCSRAILLGGLLGAATGSVPQDWIDRVEPETMKRIDAAIEKIVNHVTAI